MLPDKRLFASPDALNWEVIMGFLLSQHPFANILHFPAIANILHFPAFAINEPLELSALSISFLEKGSQTLVLLSLSVELCHPQFCKQLSSVLCLHQNKVDHRSYLFVFLLSVYPF